MLLFSPRLELELVRDELSVVDSGGVTRPENDEFSESSAAKRKRTK